MQETKIEPAMYPLQQRRMAFWLNDLLGLRVEETFQRLARKAGDTPEDVIDEILLWQEAGRLHASGQHSPLPAEACQEALRWLRLRLARMAAWS